MPASTPISQVPAQFSRFVFFSQVRSILLSLFNAVFGGLQAGFAATPLASASTIAPTSQFTTVSGSAAIETITPAVNLIPGASQTLIAAAGSSWTVGTSGNIAVAMAAVTPGNAYSFLWDGSKWHPVA